MDSNEQRQTGAGAAGFNPFGQSFWSNFTKAGKKEREPQSYDDLFKEFEEFFSMNEQKQKKTSKTSSDDVGKMKGKDITVNLEIDLMEAIHGTNKAITYARTNVCGTCSGTRMKPGTTEFQCGEC